MVAKGILGRKVGMTQVFDDEGRAVPATVIEAGPCVVVQRKTVERDGYNAIQLGFMEGKPKKVNRPMKGHFERAKVPPKRYLREFRVEEGADYRTGQEVRADIFSVGELVDVSGISRGKGFAGTVRRWGFGRGPMSHGSKYHRRVGSLGPREPARVFKGRKLPGRLGGRRVTVQALKVVQVDAGRNLLVVRGAVPGPRGALVAVRNSVKQE